MGSLFVSDVGNDQLTESPDGRLFNVIDKFQGMTVAEIREEVTAKTLPYAIMLLNIVDGRNAGNIIRTASLTGVEKVIIFGRPKFDTRCCVGAHNYVDIEKVFAIKPNKIDILGARIDYEKLSTEDANQLLDEDKFNNYIKTNNYIPIFIEQDKFSRPATNANLKEIIHRGQLLGRTPLFILGNESFGIPKNILDIRIKGLDLSYTLELKQMGCIRSYNVANCAAILCYMMMEILSGYA